MKEAGGQGKLTQAYRGAGTRCLTCACRADVTAESSQELEVWFKPSLRRDTQYGKRVGWVQNENTEKQGPGLASSPSGFIGWYASPFIYLFTYFAALPFFFQLYLFFCFIFYFFLLCFTQMPCLRLQSWNSALNWYFSRCGTYCRATLDDFGQGGDWASHNVHS